MIAKILIVLILPVVIQASIVCEKDFQAIPQAKQYIRIMKHIEEHHSSCNVVYAYGLFLNNPLMMDEIENDNVFAEELGAFAKRYPYLSRMIQDKGTFEYVNKKYDMDKKSIDEAIKYAFNNGNTKDNVDLVYLNFALDVVGEKFNSDELKQIILDIKEKYSIGSLDIILPFWETYQEKYKNENVHGKVFFDNFENIVDIYGLSLLERLRDYQGDIYTVLLPNKYGNTEYTLTIKSLLNSMKGKDIEQQMFFLSNCYLDIEVALAGGHSSENIVEFYKKYMKRDFIQRFKNMNNYEKSGIIMLVGDHLDSKLDWMEHYKNSYRKITKTILKTKDLNDLINILGLYNYASALYEKMQNNKQRKMLISLVNLPSKGNNIATNLSLIYALGENTSYFNAIINDNNEMSSNNKYKEILYVRQEGESIISLFAKGGKKGEEAYNKFVSQTNELVLKPYDEIHDLTPGEKVDMALEVADYASYATMIIPGVGIATNIGKSLLINGIKATAKNAVKAGVKEAVGSYNSIKKGFSGIKQSYNTLKNSAKQTWKNGFKNNDSIKKPINYAYRGKVHPVTGVPYNRLGYPKFDSFFDCRYPLHLNYAQQFRYCTDKLRRYLNKHPEKKDYFTSEQLKQINSKKPSIDKLTWHHHQARSKHILQLVDRQLHVKTSHTGGGALFASKLGKSGLQTDSVLENIFKNQIQSNQLLITEQIKKYGDEYLKAIKKVSDISSKGITKLTSYEIQTKFIETLNKTGKYGWKRLKEIGNIIAKYPKSTAATVAYVWYISDPESFENQLKMSGKTLTEFVLSAGSSAASGAVDVVSSKTKQIYDRKFNELSSTINDNLKEGMPYLIKSILILLFLLFIFFMWHKKDHILRSYKKTNDNKIMHYEENEHEY